MKTLLAYQTGNLVEASAAGRRALELAHTTTSRPLRATTLSNLGLVDRARGYYLNSLDHFRKGRELLDPEQHAALHYMVAFNMGLSYADLGDHAMARDFFLPALEHFADARVYGRELTALIYVAASDVVLGNAAAAEQSLREALARSEMRANKGYVGFAYAVLGEALRVQGKLPEALEAFETGLRISERVPNTFEQRRLDLGYARTLNDLDRVPQAIQHLEVAADRLRSEKSNRILLETLRYLAELNARAGNMPGLVANNAEMQTLERQLQVKEFEHELAHARAQYEVDQKERELREAERARLLYAALLVGVVVLGLIGYLVVSGRGSRQRATAQAEYARDLEQQVAVRTRELRKQIEQAEAAEEARLGMERQLGEAEKLRVLGQLTGGVAHDFNNLLTVVLGASELLAQNVPETDEKSRALLAHITGAAEAGADITRALMAYARRQPMQLEPVMLKEFLRERLPLVARALGGTVAIEEAIETGPPVVVQLDRAQLTSALINLCLNARDAQNNLGAIVVGLHARDDDWVVLSVRDVGAGMTEEQVARAIEPFYTTKNETQGHGLGLSMVYGFSKQIGGDLEISSTLGEGTEVRIILPRDRDAEGMLPEPPQALRSVS